MASLQFIPPMLATLVRTLPEGRQWEYELKLDGYRLEAIKDGAKVRLYSRRGNDFTRQFARIAQQVSTLKDRSLVLDGEAVVVDDQGKPSFQMLQNRASVPPGWNLVYYVFDLLHLNGQDLKNRSLTERRVLLEKVIANSGVLLSRSLPGTLSQILAAVEQHGLEGVIAKRVDSKYQPGHRGENWLKHPLKFRQEFVIGGFRMDGKRLELLLVGYFEGGKLFFAGKVHQGLNPANRAMLARTLMPLRTPICPFVNLPTSRTGHWGEGITAEEMDHYIWTRPKLVAEIKFSEWTTGEVLRHAEFAGLRQDKRASEVKKELPV